MMGSANHAAIVCIASFIILCSMCMADGEGTARISPPGPAIAGSTGTWEITYTPGPGGIAPGGAIRLSLSGFPIRLFATPQCDRPQDRNYTTAHCTNPDIPLQVAMKQELRGGWMNVQQLEVKVGEPGLTPGDAIVVIYGDTAQGSPGGAVRAAEGDDLPVRMSSDTDGDGRFQQLDEFPRLTLAGGAAARIALCAPAQAVVGRPARVCVSLRDARNALATEQLPSLTIAGDGLTESIDVQFPEGERAYRPVQATFTRPGVHRLHANAALARREPEVFRPADYVSTDRPQADADPEFVPQLTRVQVTATEVAPGSVLRLKADWTNNGSAAAKQSCRVFCHLERRPARGRALANWDYRPSIATTQWAPGMEVSDQRPCHIPPDTPPGDHALTLGVFYVPEPGSFVNLVSYDICRIHLGPDQPLIRDIAPARSNPVRVYEEPPARHLLWGDTHCHTENSGDGSGSIRGLYTYARDVSRLDFCACADHVGPNYPDEKWHHIQDMAREFYDPGRFVSILAYEWSNMYHGDKNVYHVHDDEPIRVPKSGQAEDLYEALEDVQCVVIPHHPAYPVGLRGVDWTRIDSSLVRVVEMCSGHGLGEYFGNPRPYGRNKPMGPSLPGGFARDALDRGLHLGFICSSDDHTAHAGKNGFLAAVYADDITREGVIDALRARRCYASTGPKILLDFRANDEPMGSIIECENPPTLEAEVHAMAPLNAVEIIENGDVCHRRTPDGESCKFSYQPDGLHDGESYYYLRVIQADGEMAWSSPIFVRNVGPRPIIRIEDAGVIGTPPRAGRLCVIAATIRNDGAEPSPPGTVQFMLDGPPSVSVAPERPPTQCGIGGLLAKPGLQLWRWPLDQSTVNVFVRWGGGEDARDCTGEIRVLDAETHVWTPFHIEDDDELSEDTPGIIRWRTNAEEGTGDGLNLQVTIDQRKPTRLLIDAMRGGKRRPDETFAHVGEIDALPFVLPLTEHDPQRWIGETQLPALAAGQARVVGVLWRPQGPQTGRIFSRVIGVPADLATDSGDRGETVHID